MILAFAHIKEKTKIPVEGHMSTSQDDRGSFPNWLTKVASVCKNKYPELRCNNERDSVNLTLLNRVAVRLWNQVHIFGIFKTVQYYNTNAQKIM